MAFAQLTWRESLRDIEARLAVNEGQLFHMWLKAPPARSTPSDALNQRDWRICMCSTSARAPATAGGPATLGAPSATAVSPFGRRRAN
jgi:hypothetical protein